MQAIPNPLLGPWRRVVLEAVLASLPSPKARPGGGRSSVFLEELKGAAEAACLC